MLHDDTTEQATVEALAPSGVQVDVKVLDARIIRLPGYATPGSAAMDLMACLDQPLVLYPHQRALVHSGVAVHINSQSYAGLVLPRSGLGHKHGVILGNSVGLIDSDYQGELLVSVWNTGPNEYTIYPMDRIAQFVLVPILRAEFNVVESFVRSERGSGGFGSTGS